MKANNYEVAEAGETITFKGLVARSTSQAFFLVFCTAIGMASLALVLQIQFQDLGEYISHDDVMLWVLVFVGLFSHAIAFIHSYSTPIINKQIPPTIHKFNNNNNK